MVEMSVIWKLYTSTSWPKLKRFDLKPRVKKALCELSPTKHVTKLFVTTAEKPMNKIFSALASMQI